MSDSPTETLPPPWSRAQPARTRPRRNAGGLYRTAEHKDPSASELPPEAPSHVLGGTPLNATNTAVVAAVRLAYRVAEAQVDRSMRLARRLREAGDKEVGANSETKGLDAAERLVMKTMLSGLEWWEGSVAEGRCPVKRLVAAEYQMIGQILGFTLPQGKKSSGGSAAASPSRPEPQPAAAAPRPAPAGARRLLVVHTGEKKQRRRVVVESWDLSSREGLDTAVFFHHAEHVEADAIPAELALADNGDLRLMIATPPQANSGRWACALADADGVQVGHIEISL
jgi:hypothetical protein